MQRAFLLLSVFMPFAALAAPAGDSASTPIEVTVTVENVKSAEGFILASLHTNGWQPPATSVTRVAAAPGSVKLTLKVPGPGRYGVRLFHDLNANGKIETNFIGIPTEPFGFSNNAPAQFGPPAFDEAAFDVGAAGASQTIGLN